MFDAIQSLEQVRAGNGAGAQQLWTHFARPMTAVARAWLRARAAPLAADEQDVVQIAFTGFCQRLRRGHYAGLSESKAVWRVLKAAVMRNALRMIRDANRLKRGGQGADAANPCGERRHAGHAGLMELAQVPTHGLDPAREAEAMEEFLAILDKLALSEDLWRIALWKMYGFTNEEIAGLLDCALATVERRLADIRRTLTEHRRQ